MSISKFIYCRTAQSCEAAGVPWECRDGMWQASILAQVYLTTDSSFRGVFINIPWVEYTKELALRDVDCSKVLLIKEETEAQKGRLSRLRSHGCEVTLPILNVSLMSPCGGGMLTPGMPLFPLLIAKWPSQRCSTF